MEYLIEESVVQGDVSDNDLMKPLQLILRKAHSQGVS
jgi:hypothetical protein